MDLDLCWTCHTNPCACAKEPDSFAFAIEELRLERRKYARLEAAARDAMDNLRRDEPAYRRLELALADPPAEGR